MNLIWIIFIGISLLSYIVQANLNRKFKKYSKESLGNGMTGRDVAEKMLRDNGIYDVQVTSVPGFLTDHYDPTKRTVNLSSEVYSSCSVAAAPALATTLVGVLAVCNGLGRVVTGVLYDWLGRRTTMISANILTIAAAGITLIAVRSGSLPLCIVGLCLTGMSYGSCPTVTSAFSAGFYGQKYFAVNYSITNFNLIFASFIATGANSLLIATGGYTAPFVMLLAIAVGALGLNFTIKERK